MKIANEYTSLENLGFVLDQRPPLKDRSLGDSNLQINLAELTRSIYLSPSCQNYECAKNLLSYCYLKISIIRTLFSYIREYRPQV